MARKKSTLGSTLSALQAAESQVQALRQRAASERTRLLAGLHAQCGFGSRQELIDALLGLGGPGRRGTSKGSAAKGSVSKANGMNGSAAGSGARKRKRALITNELRNDVIKAVQAGEAGGAVAKRFSISSQTVQNIKKAAGLVKARKKKG
jgi:hypothetical protein